LARQSFFLYRAREFVVNYGTADPSGDATALRNQFLRRFPGVSGKRCLLFLGRVHAKKGLDLLLRALHEIRSGVAEKMADDVRLVIAGPNDNDFGRQLSALADQLGIAGQVIWAGMLTGDLKWGAFHTADAFVLPSHQENFGIAVAESLACRVPVLISNRVNIWREIREDNAGFVEADDLDGTRRLLERWLSSDRESWRAMRSNARSCFERRFDLRRSADSLVRLFEHVIKHPDAIPAGTGI
jgi:glycosyltransferase involved in cell wall biosynthesis